MIWQKLPIRAFQKGVGEVVSPEIMLSRRRRRPRSTFAYGVHPAVRFVSFPMRYMFLFNLLVIGAMFGATPAQQAVCPRGVGVVLAADWFRF